MKLRPMPFVTAIMPTSISRKAFLKESVDSFLNQDYDNGDSERMPQLELIIIDSDKSIKIGFAEDIIIKHITNVGNLSVGEKRNMACRMAIGDIIVHFDDDDVYAYNWISKSVAALLSSKGNLTGLSSAYFESDTQRWLYQYPKNAQPYVCGATMCYYKSLWEKNPFKDISEGEDTHFCTNAIVRPHDYIDGFTARIHVGNTCSHKQLNKKEFTLISP